MQQCEERVSGKPAIEPPHILHPLRHKGIISLQRRESLLPEGLPASDKVVKEYGSADRRCHSEQYEHDDAAPKDTT